MLTKPVCGTVGCMLWVVVVLENNSMSVKPMSIERRHEFIREYLTITLRVEFLSDFRQAPDTLNSHAPPDHDGAATKLNCWSDMLWQCLRPWLLPIIVATRRIEENELALVGEINILPVSR